jgi:hypothetical protein
MNTLEQYLALSVIEKSCLDDLDIEGMVEAEGDIWLLFNRRSKKGSKYKVRMSRVLWSSMDKVYQTYIWSDMLAKGYLLVNIEGGSIVVGPDGEQHQLSESGCTCEYFSFTKKMCKHLMFREGELSYRGRQVEAYDHIVNSN